jgi:hypothetical protein
MAVLRHRSASTSVAGAALRTILWVAMVKAGVAIGLLVAAGAREATAFLIS